jgi:hypothetical protein
MLHHSQTPRINLHLYPWLLSIVAKVSDCCVNSRMHHGDGFSSFRCLTFNYSNDYDLSTHVHQGSHGPSKASAYNSAVSSAEPQRGGPWWKQKQVLRLFSAAFLV